MNLDKRQRVDVGTGSGFENCGDLVRELARPTGLQRTGVTAEEDRRLPRRMRYNVCHFWESKESKYPRGAVPSDGDVNPLGQLQDLPVEIRAAILHHTVSLADLYCFSTAHDLLFNIGYEVAKSRYVGLRSTWIGDRIVAFTADDDLTMLSLPDGLLKPEETMEAMAAIGRMPEMLHPITYYRHTCLQVNASARGFPTTNVSFEVRERMRRAGVGHRWTKADTRRMENLLAIDVDFAYNYRSICPWTIYNLSKGELIRGHVIFPRNDDAGDAPEHDALACNDEGLGLGAVLMSRILWSSQGSYSDRYVGGLTVWAGDRFEIAPSNQVPVLHAKVNGGCWKDVSLESLQLVRKVFPTVARGESTS